MAERRDPPSDDGSRGPVRPHYERVSVSPYQRADYVARAGDYAALPDAVNRPPRYMQPPDGATLSRDALDALHRQDLEEMDTLAGHYLTIAQIDASNRRWAVDMSQCRLSLQDLQSLTRAPQLVLQWSTTRKRFECTLATPER